MTTELMITGCVTVKADTPAIEQMIILDLESILRGYGTHVAVDIPDLRDRSPKRDKRGRFL